LAIKIKNLSLTTKPKGKTVVLKGDHSLKGETILLHSHSGEVVFYDLDSYVEVHVKINKSPSVDTENRFFWTYKTPLVEGNFVINSVITKTIDVQPKRK